MGQFLAKRLLQVPVVLWVLVTISFFMVRLAPGGPFSGEKRMPKEIEQAMMAKYHLDESLPRQYARFLWDLVAHGDLGPSYKHKTRTVNEIIAHKLPYSLTLGGLATVLALWLGLGAGIVAGIRQNSRFDYASMAIAMVGLSVPAFVVGPLLQLAFSMKLGWLPVSGWDGLGHMVLPSLTLALPFAARIARLTRAGMLEVIHQDYIRTAWAKGLSERVIVLRHALRGALLPVVSFLGPGIAAMLTGSLVVERIFGIPGVGSEFVESALNRDYTLVMGTVILYGVLLVVMNLLVDIVYGFLDPRIRYGA
ncbi:MAG: ABC transporter permease subunit [Planctomycetota bacterium]|nr:MAG: ABC transporter permease subunit [Planctomycetota bacterium]